MKCERCGGQFPVTNLYPKMGEGSFSLCDDCYNALKQLVIQFVNGEGQYAFRWGNEGRGGK